MSISSAAAIRDGLEQSRWTVVELWRATLGISGSLTPQEVADLTSGQRPSSPFQHDILASALNDHFTDIGGDHPVPYWRDLVAS